MLRETIPASSQDTLPLEFPFPKHIKYLVCCDLDETYIPFLEAHKVHGGVSDLEEFLCEFGAKKGIVIGWIMGANLKSALRKSKGYIHRSPHFICCSLGTEFYWVRQGRLIPSTSWQKNIESSGFKKEHIDEIIAKAHESSIYLTKQPKDYQGAFKASYYYKNSPSFAADLAWLEKISSSYGIRVLLTKCNPAAGDPADSYDADFIPACCGKDQAVDFISKQLCVAKDNILAFGDSCNNFSMFSRAGRSFLTGNADPAAKPHMRHQLEKPYCHGILSVLRELRKL